MNVLGAIGNTPLVELERVVPAGSARVVAKLEGANPTWSLMEYHSTDLFRTKRGT
jgi:cysteine synthase A